MGLTICCSLLCLRVFRSAPSIHSVQEQVWWTNSIKLRVAVWGGLSAGSAALAAVAVLVRGYGHGM